MLTLNTPSTSPSNGDSASTINRFQARCLEAFSDRPYNDGRTGLEETTDFQLAASEIKSDFDSVFGVSKRKSTACETELDFLGEGGVEELSQPRVRKPSLLAGLTPGSQRNFETLVLEETQDSECLGKRSCLPSWDIEMNSDQQGEAHNLESRPTLRKRLSDNVCPGAYCSFGHRYSAATGQGEDACLVCKSVINNIRRFAEDRSGRLLSQVLTAEILLACEHGHQWTVSYKKATKSWCRDCKSKRKQLLKDMLEQETAQKNEERKQRQEKLLKEAKERMQLGEQMQREEQKKDQENLKIIMEEISRIASKYAREYCQKDASCDFAQILLLYQTLILPEKNLMSLFQSWPKEKAKKEFRRYTILLHPDKNSHPKAKQAFQKVYALFSALADNC